jgi:hypothetical protein
MQQYQNVIIYIISLRFILYIIFINDIAAEKRHHLRPTTLPHTNDIAADQRHRRRPTTSHQTNDIAADQRHRRIPTTSPQTPNDIAADP